MSKKIILTIATLLLVAVALIACEGTTDDATVVDPTPTNTPTPQTLSSIDAEGAVSATSPEMVQALTESRLDLHPPTATPKPTPTATPLPTPFAKHQESIDADVSKMQALQAEAKLQAAKNELLALQHDGKATEAKIAEAQIDLQSAIDALDAAKVDGDSELLLAEARRILAQGKLAETRMEKDSQVMDHAGECVMKRDKAMADGYSREWIIANLTCVTEYQITVPLPTPTPTPPPPDGEVKDHSGAANRLNPAADFVVYRSIGSFKHEDAGYIQTQHQHPMAIISVKPRQSVCSKMTMYDVEQAAGKAHHNLNVQRTNPRITLYQGTREATHSQDRHPIVGHDDWRLTTLEAKLHSGQRYYFILWSEKPKEQPNDWWYTMEGKAYADAYYTLKFTETADPQKPAVQLC